MPPFPPAISDKEFRRYISEELELGEHFLRVYNADAFDVIPFAEGDTYFEYAEKILVISSVIDDVKETKE